MLEVQLNDDLVLYAKDKVLDPKHYQAIADVVEDIQDTIDVDSKLRKVYGVGTLFRCDGDSSYGSLRSKALVALDHHYEINDALMNREILNVSELKRFIERCKYTVVVCLLRYDNRLFAVIINHLTVFGESVVDYSLLAMVIEDK